MSSILFHVGRDLVNEVQAGIKAHNDVKEGKPVERREDKWGDPMAPKTVYSLVRGVEEQLGMGKGKGKATQKDKGKSDDLGKNDQAVKPDQASDSKSGQPSAMPVSGSPSAGALNVHDQIGQLVSECQASTASPPPHPAATDDKVADATVGQDQKNDSAGSQSKMRMKEEAAASPSIGVYRTADRIQLDALGVPVPRESGVATEHRPPPPPPPTRADKIHKGLETADDVAADIALGVVIGNVLDGPTQTLVEGLMMIENDDTPQSKKNREALKAARKEIDKQTPKRHALAEKLASYEEKMDEPAGGRSEKEVEKDHKRLKEKMDDVKKDLAKVEGKLEKAEYDVAKYKPRVEEFERLTIENRARKLKAKQEKEAAKKA